MPGLPVSRVLIIAHEFPPSAGGGVQRVTKFARYLREEGWQVHVIAAEPLVGRPRDETLTAQVAGVPVERMPARDIATTIARALAPAKRLVSLARSGVRTAADGSAPDGASGAAVAPRIRSPLSARLAKWVAMPDDAVLWSRRVPALAARLHREAPFDVVLASGPPYSALLAGVRAGRRLGIPVVLDMRDAWKNSYHSDWPTNGKRRRFVELEREAMGGASAVVTVTNAIAAEAAELGARRVVVLPNGFDPTEMPDWAPRTGAGFTFIYLGRLSPGVSDPSVAFAALARARQLDPAMAACRFEIVGPAAPWAEALAAKLGVSDAVRFHDFKPYDEALQAVAGADCGVIMLADGPASAGVYSGKLFDYLGIGIPILVFGPEGSGAAEVARETGCGRVVPGDDVERAAGVLIEMVAAKRDGAPCVTDPDVRARFDRRSQVGLLSELLAEVARP